MSGNFWAATIGYTYQLRGLPQQMATWEKHWAPAKERRDSFLVVPLHHVWSVGLVVDRSTSYSHLVAVQDPKELSHQLRSPFIAARLFAHYTRNARFTAEIDLGYAEMCMGVAAYGYFTSLTCPNGCIAVGQNLTTSIDVYHLAVLAGGQWQVNKRIAAEIQLGGAALGGWTRSTWGSLGLLNTDPTNTNVTLTWADKPPEGIKAGAGIVYGALVHYRIWARHELTLSARHTIGLSPLGQGTVAIYNKAAPIAVTRVEQRGTRVAIGLGYGFLFGH